MLRSELLKLKRSSIWLIAVVMPLLAVITGTINFASNPDQLDAGWASFTSQVTLFYGLVFSSVSIGLLAAVVWRPEHRGTNWNLLATHARTPVRLVLAKTAAIALAVAVMQAVLVTATLIAGVVVLGLQDAAPWRFALVGALAVVAALPLIAAQSLLSMLLRSFTAPVAICLVGCVAGVASVTSEALRPLGTVLPQALNTRALNLGGTSLAGSGDLSAADALPIVVAAIGVALVIVGASVAAIRWIKLR
ncbi:ABC transporter permease [Arenivirga flava]|uniref:Lantibiotic ABC transporter permease n=1 Tax=Arenivirga flava TaxID=1930060 RepID=A0AA37XAX1_9MICO|nr:ABC transporter permease [Arenivirga flava]GMA27705.1 hypothetical protein GCM10025874_09580 [Arenivirga flava]